MEILIDAAKIADRVRELGTEISAYYGQEPVTMVALLNGAMVFAADLMRHLEVELTVDSLGVASYAGTQRTAELRFRSRLKLPVNGRRILLLDDILDSGVTLNRVRHFLLEEGATEVKTCVLLDKEVVRAPEALQAADWHGFRIPDRFAVGYGLDAEERYRHLPAIWVL